jgi:predicted amidohydrolase
VLHQLPDIFCELYDGLDMDAFRERAPGWMADDGIRSTAIDMERQLADGSLNAAGLRLKLNNHSDRERTRFAILRALDSLFASFNPAAATGAGMPALLAPLAAKVAATHRLDSGAHGGALISRLVRREDPHHAPDHPREAFASVLRVEAQHWDAARFVTLPEEALLHRHEIERGLAVGCTPLIEDPAEMVIKPYRRDHRRLYRIEPADEDVTRRRVEAVLDAMIAAQVRLGVVPELMLTEALLQTWKSALAARRGATGKLLWLLVGSGNLDSDGARITEAVLLNARTGAELARQRKLYPFHFDIDTLQLWGMEGLLGGEPIAEDVKPGSGLTIIEGGGLRLAILVCEDLARVADLAALVRSFGVSHLLVPIFGRPIKDHHWERANANTHCRATGSTVVVANSLVMHSICGLDEGTGLVVWPGDAKVLKAKAADDVACFTLGRDGSVVA